jgi:hypothetical protein
MSAGDFLRNAWNVTAQTAEAGLEKATNALGTAENAIESVVAQAVSYGTVGVKAAVIVSQVPGYLSMQAAVFIYSKAEQAFSPLPIASIVGCCPKLTKFALNANIENAQKMLAAAQKQGLSEDPRVQALQELTEASVKALMSDDVYCDPELVGSKCTPIEIPGYHRLTNAELDSLGVSSSQFSSESPNFHAALYVTDTSPATIPPRYTLAFRGTAKDVDWVTNAENALGIESKPYGKAATLAATVQLAVSHQQDATLDVTGHSLGGGLAQAASSALNLKGVIFNGAGLNPNSVSVFKGDALKQNIVDYHVAGDPVTTAQASIVGLSAAQGKQVELPGPMDAGLIGLHSMDSVEAGLVDSGMKAQEAVAKLLGGP